jgi:hypothetical protein
MSIYSSIDGRQGDFVSQQTGQFHWGLGGRSQLLHPAGERLDGARIGATLNCSQPPLSCCKCRCEVPSLAFMDDLERIPVRVKYIGGIVIPDSIPAVPAVKYCPWHQPQPYRRSKHLTTWPNVQAFICTLTRTSTTASLKVSPVTFSGPSSRLLP